MKGYAHLQVTVGLLIIGLFAMLPAFGKDYTLAEVFSGKSVPLSITLGEMSAEWKQFDLKIPEMASSGLDLLLMLSIAEDGEDPFSFDRPFYTNGDIVFCGQQSYLIAYRLQAASSLPRNSFAVRYMMMEMYIGGEKKEIPDLATPGTRLSLCLLNFQQGSSLSNLRSFDLDRELAAMNASLVAALARQEGEDTTERSMSNLKQLALAVSMYAQENEEMLPDFKTSKDFARLLDVEEIVTCHPVTKEPYLANISIAGKSLDSFVKPAETPLFYEASPAEDGSRNVAFLDGHVEQVSAEDWEALREEWGLE